MSPQEIAAAAGRGLYLVGLTAATGGALAVWFSRSTAGELAAEGGPGAGTRSFPLLHTGARWRLGAPLFLLVALAILFAAQLVAFRDPFEPLTAQIQGLLTRTDWGRVFSLQVLLAVTMVLAPVRRRAVLFGALALISASSLAFMGHSWAVEGGRWWTVTAEVAHAVSAAIWLGGLSVLVAAHRYARTIPEGSSFDLAHATARFSAAALVAVPAIFLTGAVASWVHGGGPSALFEPGWGRTLAIKIGLVAGMACLGFYNWRVTLPKLRAGESGVGFGKGAAAWEALLGLAVLGATAWLVALSPPGGS